MRPRIDLVLFLLLFSSPLAAQEADTYGTGPRQRAMGAAGVAGVRGHDALYYNPAALTRTWTIQGRADLSIAFPSVDVRSDKPEFDRDAEDELETILFLSVGAAGPLLFDECSGCKSNNAHFSHPCPVCGKLFSTPEEKSSWLDGVYWGFWLELPSSAGQGVTVTSDQENPEWAQYGRSYKRVALSTGLAYRFTDWISAGISFHLISFVSGELTNEIKSLSPSFSNIEIDNEARFAFSVNLGVLYTPVEGLDIGLAYRSERAGEIENNATTIVDAIGFPTKTVFLIEATTNYSPQQLTLGVHWDVFENWSVTAEITWLDWSAYPSPYSKLTVIEPKTSSGVTAPPHPEAKYRDILVPRIGVEFRIPPHWSLRAGYAYRPSPAPDQDGPTNILDPTTHLVTLGGAYRFTNGMEISTYIQFHLFQKQKGVQVDFDGDGTSEPPNPWEVSGTVILFGLSFGFTF